MWNCAGVKVTYYVDHVGHDHELAHQQLTREQRSQIAGMLATGIPFDDVLDKIQLSGDNSMVSRLHLTSKQDLKNIVRDFNLSSSVTRCQNDADSVAAWIEQNKLDGERSIVRYVKFQGEADTVRGLSADDFMLVLMSEAQIVALLNLYRPLKEVAMDSTHGTNAYDYQLTTLMVVDEHGEGYPAAFCFSNRVTETTMHTFLTVCKETLGRPLTDAVLMTDDTEVYANAWTAVMGCPAHRLLCAWHIDRVWRKNMAKITGDSLLKATVYKTVRALMELPDREAFEEKLAEFLTTAAADKKTEHFAAYFHKEYASRPQLWAFCYRRGLQVHHNMHLEALHRVLKHVHMNGRKVKRMDSCIHALLRLMRSKLHDRLLKVHKGKWTRHIMGIRNRHRKGIACDPALVTTVAADTAYAVKSPRTDDVYLVEQNDTVPHATATCQLRCQACNVCVHTFSCNCMDAGLRSTICKHVHLVVSVFHPLIRCMPESEATATANSPMLHNTNSAFDGEDNEQIYVDDVDVATELVTTAATVRSAPVSETDAILEAFSSQAPSTHTTTRQNIEKAKQHWNTICTEMEVDENPEVIATVCEDLVRLKSLISALKLKPQLAELKEPRQPSNKKMTTQRYFASTKRKPKKRKAEESMSKPDNKEKAYLLSSLSGQTEVISSTLCDTDHDYHARPDDIITFEHNY